MCYSSVNIERQMETNKTTKCSQGGCNCMYAGLNPEQKLEVIKCDYKSLVDCVFIICVSICATTMVCKYLSVAT